MRFAHFLLAAALASGLTVGMAASAEIYRWTDASGQLHFTKRLDRVPSEHRESALRSALKPPSRSVQTFSVTGSAAGEQATPQPRRSRGDGILKVPFVREGTLMRIEARLNDAVTAPFLVDTGASGVSLPSHVAEQLGMRLRSGTPQVRVMTAAGPVSRALVKLDSVEVGGARVEGLEATVNPAMNIGLLGGSFFNNFIYQVDATARVITLAPNQNLRGGFDAVEWRDRFRRLLDPLAKLEAHLDAGNVRRQGERNVLERRRVELETEIERLELEANRLDVPASWRQ
jgi:clan AA aspartic protease (TIGR02281 family)